MIVEGGNRNKQELGEKNVRNTTHEVLGHSWKNNSNVTILVVRSADMELNETSRLESVAEIG